MPRVENPFGGKTRSQFMSAFWREGSSQALAWKDNQRKASAERADNQLAVWPLVLRGATVGEIMLLKEMDRTTVEGAIRRLRSHSNPHRPNLPKPTPKQTSELKKKSKLGVPRGKAREYTQQELYSFAFAKKLIANGLTDDLTNWDFFVELFALNIRGLPALFPDQLLSEFYVVAVREAAQGNGSLLDKYNELGEEVDTAWFSTHLSSERKFIDRALQSDKLQVIQSRYDSLLERIQVGEFIEGADTRLLEVIRRFLSEGLLPDEVGDLVELRSMPAPDGRSIISNSDSLLIQLRYEAFRRVRLRVEEHEDKSQLETYMAIGEAIDEDWFYSREASEKQKAITLAVQQAVDSRKKREQETYSKIQLSDRKSQQDDDD